MKEKPILFSSPMVQAILKGRKTQTRRVIRGAKCDYQFLGLDDNMAICATDKYGDEHPKDVEGLYATFECDGRPQFPVFKSRYQPGDILWVRETWADYDRLYYKATEPDAAKPVESGDVQWFKWRPSIHMPRKAARIFLRVTDVRAERLHQISEADAQAEGIRSYFLHKEHGGEWHESTGTFVGATNAHPTRITAYAELWDSLNAKRGYSWDSNPWVWVYEFERISRAEDTND